MILKFPSGEGWPKAGVCDVVPIMRRLISVNVERLVRTALTLTLSEYQPCGFANLDR